MTLLLKPNAWYYFALFVAVIIALILEPIPAAAVGLIGVTAATVSPWVAPKPADAIKWALSGFQDGTGVVDLRRLHVCVGL